MQRKSLLTLLTLLVAAIVHAQAPVLDASNNPVAGDWNITYATDTFAQGLGGAAQTWHFETLHNYHTDTFFFSDCSANPYCAYFPGTTVYGHANGDTTSSYLHTSSTGTSFVGEYYGGPVYYSDPEDELRFPFSYDSSYTDAFESTFTSGGYTYHRRGTVSVRADAYGTLVLPNHTYPNALRIRTLEIFSDSTTVSGSPYGYAYNNLSYTWYVPGQHVEVLNLTKYNSSSSPTRISSYYTYPAPTAVADVQIQDAVIQLSPNPADQQVTIHCDAAFGAGSWVNIYTMDGRHAGKFPLLGNDSTIPVADLPNGMYECRIYRSGCELQVKKLLVRR